MRKIFIICPVRNTSQKINEKIADYVMSLERQGAKVYWPFIHTDQNDSIGINICEQNRRGIIWANEIHIWFDKDSRGSLFDVGMTFAFLIFAEKKIVLINKEEIKPTKEKSFQNVLLELEKMYS